MEWTDTTGEGWTLQVAKAGRVMGRILHGAPDGKYRFYKGGGGPGTPLLQQPVLENSDLEQLKAALKNLT
ncbi:MAG: hypothetical protein ACREKS_08805 [Candidatus Rokuibacteriota bacterium]